MKQNLQLSKEALEVAELYTRLEKIKAKQVEGVPMTRHGADSVRACRQRIQELLQRVGGVEEIRIMVEDARTLAEYFSGIRFLPEFEKDAEKGARLFKAMLAIFGFKVTLSTIATYYYSIVKRELKFTK